MASLSWPGGTLSNIWQNSPADRVNSYEPASDVIGPRHVGLGTNRTHVWRYTDRHTVTFALNDIALSDLAACLSLALHLAGGGVVTLALNDPGAHVYANLAIAPDADTPRPKYNRGTNRYELALALVNLDDAPILADYR